MRRMTQLSDYVYDHLKVVYLGLLLVCTVAIAGLIGLGIYLVEHDRDRVAENRELIKRVQDERTSSIIRQCQSRTSRHDNALESLRLIYLTERKKLAPGASPAALNASERRAVILINAIVPKEDCLALAREAVDVTRREDADTPARP